MHANQPPVDQTTRPLPTRCEPILTRSAMPIVPAVTLPEDCSQLPRPTESADGDADDEAGYGHGV